MKKTRSRKSRGTVPLNMFLVNTLNNWIFSIYNLYTTSSVRICFVTSVVVRHCFDADPDPTFHFDAGPIFGSLSYRKFYTCWKIRTHFYFHP
jgi:hypothetical protein